MVTRKQHGFTIIEVVLVLAIAGLIFLMVFIALPALQRSQRDTQRKNDLSRFMSQISAYQSNNKGNTPANSDVASFVTSYLKAGGDTFVDPNGSDYAMKVGAGTPSAGQIQYSNNARCGDGGAVTANAAGVTNTRQVAASVGLEGGGAYCQQN